MDTNQRDPSPAVPAGPEERKDDAASPGSPPRPDGTEVLAKGGRLPPWPEAPVASNLRKAAVRAALFHKPEPIRIGRFILLEPLGAGAMGEIYAAYDDKLDRKVALKLVRGGSELTAKADERLLREAQALAQVSHPNVVQIYGPGTYNGRLFIAMELIRGKTLTSWLRDAARLPRAVRQREILRQFIAAGRGLEAAHAAGVAHRDFKPDNVLVGDDGRVRVVDFGLARAMEDDAQAGRPADDGEAALSRAAAQELAEGPTVQLGRGDAGDTPLVTGATTIDHEPAPAPAAVGATPRAASQGDAAPGAPKLKAALRLTETGTVMGTPSFMAPETLRGVIADRRSDQFSFCVALYHALYDAFPFTGRTLRELRDSMKSDRIEFVSGVPVPAYVRKALHRGLSVEPSQRFASMTELLAALEPRSRRRGWIAAGAGFVAIAASTAMALRSQAPADPCAAAGAAIDAEWSADRQAAIHAAFSRSDLPYAASAWRGVEARLDDYAHRWRGDATAACRATYVAHTQSAEQLDRRMLCLELGRRQVAALASELATGTPGVVEHAIEAAAALPDLDACSHAENLLFGVAPPPAAVAAEVAAVRDRLAHARALELLGRYDESLAVARDASATTERLGYPPVRAEALVQVARALTPGSTADTRAEAQKLYFEALTIAEAERHDQLALEIWTKLVALAVRMDSSMAQAHEWWGQAYAWSRRNAPSAGGGSGARAELHYQLGEIYYGESDYAKAADEERRAIGSLVPAPADPLALSRYDSALAKALERLGVADEAMQLQQRAVAIATEALGAGHPKVIQYAINYGWILRRHGRNAEARSVLEGALASMAPRYRDSHLDAGKIHGVLSVLEFSEGHLDRATEHARTSLQIYGRTLPPDHLFVAEAYWNLANPALMRRNFTDARSLFQRALDIRRRHLGSDDYLVGLTELAIAEPLLHLERYDDAMVHLVEAERILQRSSGHERTNQEWLLTVRGEILTGQRKFAAAVPVLENALRLFGDAPTDLLVNEALARWTLARALHGLGKDPSRVRSLAERARAIFTGLGEEGAHDRDDVARFLARLPRPVPQDPSSGQKRQDR